MKWFVDSAANWFESIGFILAIITAYKVFIIDEKVLNFNKKHLFQVRSKEHISDLKDISKKMTKSISDFENKKTELKTLLKKSEEVAKSIQKKLLKKDINNTKLLIKEAKRIEKLPENINDLGYFKKIYYKNIKSEEFNENVMSNYYVQLSGLITSLEELKKDNAKSLTI